MASIDVEIKIDTTELLQISKIYCKSFDCINHCRKAITCNNKIISIANGQCLKYVKKEKN